MPKIKICGNHSESDIQALLEYLDDLDHVGFIFTPKSKRKAEPDKIKEWLQAHSVLARKAVAVFLDQGVAEMADILSSTGISIAQLHGSETVEDISELRKLSQAKIWKVIPIERGACLEALHENEYGEETGEEHGKRLEKREGWIRRLGSKESERSKLNLGMLEQVKQKLAHYRQSVDAFLLDTQIKGQSGGTGKTFDWSILPELYAQEQSLGIYAKPIWIAGGIGAHNLANVIKLEGLYGVDLASGAETDGQKDREKVRKLIEGMRSYETRGSDADAE